MRLLDMEYEDGDVKEKQTTTVKPLSYPNSCSIGHGHTPGQGIEMPVATGNQQVWTRTGEVEEERESRWCKQQFTLIEQSSILIMI